MNQANLASNIRNNMNIHQERKGEESHWSFHWLERSGYKKVSGRELTNLMKC